MIIIDGAKLKKIKKIEAFLEKAYHSTYGEKQTQANFQTSSQTSSLIAETSSISALGNVSDSEIKAVEKKNIQVSNNPNTFDVLKKTLKEETYVQALVVNKDVVQEKYVPLDAIFKKDG